ncbi:hypothetical protein NOCA2480154 [metagenome]|uniref:Orc1-like AAA ATPase domain-containing protein n=1 Tax=metagenome TaxID=256318 RepID=A0A2P2CBB8_9ZZZZ
MLVGRHTESHLIAGRVASARLGESAVLVISGEAGIGKSALLAHCAELVDGMQTHWVVGSEAERDLAFGGLSQLFGPGVELAGLPEPQAHALGVALAMRSGGAVDRFAVGAATLGMLGRLAESAPRAVFIDDAHLLDRPSADAIAFAVRRLVADQVLVVAAVRSGEPSPFLDAGLSVLELTGLDLGAGLELLAADLDAVLSAADAARLVTATGGNPLALLELAGQSEELLRHGPDEPLTVSDSLAQTFLARTAGLSRPARACLLTASPPPRPAVSGRRSPERARCAGSTRRTWSRRPMRDWSGWRRRGSCSGTRWCAARSTVPPPRLSGASPTPRWRRPPTPTTSTAEPGTWLPRHPTPTRRQRSRWWV